MSTIRPIRKVLWLLAMTLLAPLLLFAGEARAQPTGTPEANTVIDGRCPMMDAGGGCPMMNMGSGWMTAGMILTGLLTLAAIGALVALTVFLVRRSRPRPPSAA